MMIEHAPADGDGGPVPRALDHLAFGVADRATLDGPVGGVAGHALVPTRASPTDRPTTDYATLEFRDRAGDRAGIIHAPRPGIGPPAVTDRCRPGPAGRPPGHGDGARRDPRPRSFAGERVDVAGEATRRRRRYTDVEARALRGSRFWSHGRESTPAAPGRTGSAAAPRRGEEARCAGRQVVPCARPARTTSQPG
ncbi:hypothetical protein HBB16_17870 [Pseudonocardia sp. MCCB 268]|nr:hypothetical protein [Pseudonocardia cytotoxica]